MSGKECALFLIKQKNYKLIIFYLQEACESICNIFSYNSKKNSSVSSIFCSNFIISPTPLSQFHIIFARWLGEMDQRHNNNNNNKKHTERNSRILSKNFQTLFLHFKRLAPARIKKKNFFHLSFSPKRLLEIVMEFKYTQWGLWYNFYFILYIFLKEGNFTCKWRLTIECVMICGNLYCKKGKERKQSHKKLRIFYGRLFVMKIIVYIICDHKTCGHKTYKL